MGNDATAVSAEHPNIKSVETHGHGRWAMGRIQYAGPVQGPTPTLGQHHRHDDDYELHYLAAGELGYRVGKQRLRLTPGHMCLVPPGVQHGPARSRFNQCILWWGRFPKQLLDWQPQPDTPLHRGIAAASEAGAFRLQPSFEKLLDAVLDCAFRRGPFGGYYTRNRFQDVIYSFCEAALLGPERVGLHMSHEVQAAAQRLSLRCDENEPIATVAAAVGLSVRQFNSRFKDETGYTPQAFRLQQRIRRAREHIAAKEMSLTDIAMSLGFSSSQHFSTVFKRLTGYTPKEYAALAAARAAASTAV